MSRHRKVKGIKGILHYIITYMGHLHVSTEIIEQKGGAEGVQEIKPFFFFLPSAFLSCKARVPESGDEHPEVRKRLGSFESALTPPLTH